MGHSTFTTFSAVDVAVVLTTLAMLLRHAVRDGRAHLSQLAR